MATTALITSHRYLEHETGRQHPERADRLRAIHERLESARLIEQTLAIDPAPAERSEIETVHNPSYIQRLETACSAGQSLIDSPDCPICPATFEIARLAAGGVLTAVDAVMDGRARNAFVACRPPGHHAESDRAMGFCFFNNVAIAAERLRRKHGLSRLAIIDWDVHHGNGTQHHFESEPNVFFCSIHQHPDTLYPGTGYSHERGHGDGVGATLNVPMPPRSGDEEYRRAFSETILPAVAEFRPEFVLISAGFDAHLADPLAHMALSTEAFGWMTAQVRSLAESACNGRLVSALEGGYDLGALADSVQAHLETLMQ